MTTRFPNRGSCYVSYLPTGAARFVSALDIASLYLLARHVQILSLHSPNQIHLPPKSKPYITCLLLLILPRSQPWSRRDNKSANLLHPQPQLPPSIVNPGTTTPPTTSPPNPKMHLLLPLLFLLPLATASDTPCGATNPDCPSPLTCIPLTASCTVWPRCPGTCQALDRARQRIYTLCGGWRMMDDCDERIESCVADPRREGECGPSCDGPGICLPLGETCRAAVEGGEPVGCPEGTDCFFTTDWMGVKRTTGMCFPLRYGSDFYERSRGEEVVRTDQDGYQRGG